MKLLSFQNEIKDISVLIYFFKVKKTRPKIEIIEDECAKMEAMNVKFLFIRKITVKSGF